MAALDEDCSTSEGEGLMIIDGESGDELEDLTDIVGRSNDNSPKRSKKKKKRNPSCLKSHQHEVAVGSDAGDVEEELYPADDYAEFEDDGYAPSLGPDDIDVDALDDEHRVEVEEIPEGGDGEDDDDDVIDVDEEDGGVRLSKRGTLKNEARSKVHLLTHRYKNPYWNLVFEQRWNIGKPFEEPFKENSQSLGIWSRSIMSITDALPNKTTVMTKSSLSLETGIQGCFSHTHRPKRTPMQLSQLSNSSWVVGRFEKHILMMPLNLRKPWRSWESQWTHLWLGRPNIIPLQKELTNSYLWQQLHVCLRQEYHHAFGCMPSDVWVTCSTSSPTTKRWVLGANFMGKSSRERWYPLVPLFTSSPVVHMNGNNNTNLILWESPEYLLVIP